MFKGLEDAGTSGQVGQKGLDQPNKYNYCDFHTLVQTECPATHDAAMPPSHLGRGLVKLCTFL